MTNTKQPNNKTEYADQHFDNLFFYQLKQIDEIWGSINKVTDEELVEITEDVRELWLVVNEFREKWEHIREEQ